MKFRFPTSLLLSAALALSPLPVLAHGPHPPPPAESQPLPDWDHLSEQQRKTLVDALRLRWNESPEQRGRMLHHSERWLEMTPEQREQAKRGMHRFEKMSPHQRREARALFDQMRQMTPEQRKQLRERWRTMTPEQRSQWVDAHPPRSDDKDRD